METHKVSFKEKDRYIFNQIRDGIKVHESRAGGGKYDTFLKGDVLVFVCGNDVLEKSVVSVEHFNSLEGLLQSYRPEQIERGRKTKEDIDDLFGGFPGYMERIEKYGIFVFTLR